MAIRGKVVPATVTNVHLVAEYADGKRTEGEAKIPRPNVRIKKLFLKPEDAKPTTDALEAIAGADVIILGPGSLYTSVIPNLIINGITEAIMRSSAFKIYVCNVMTQHGETDGYAASDHLQAILGHTKKDIVNACLINNAIAPKEMLGRYENEHSFPVKPDSELIRDMGCLAVEEDLLGVTDYVRHDLQKLTQALIKLIERHRVIKR